MDGRRNGRKASRRVGPPTNRRRRTGAAAPKDALVEAVRQSRAATTGSRVVELMARRALVVAARQLLRQHTDRCTKCGSTFVTHEPAFVHCHYCGRMHRVANASLLEQELFEIRMGLRLAS
ncbi:MAG: hypothetical protein HYU51_01735 [Candidatus Rokubacteria bacterium]|nr:hypothetical protein [Candidatus Rokubacteria bacterium]